jgi:hypothetical protein
MCFTALMDQLLHKVLQTVFAGQNATANTITVKESYLVKAMNLGSTKG